ncbi:MAG: glycosyltransferase family 4 protein [Dehalococcoidia bacterium]|nr:glycosyltransferase family 4 protein [Dehalococcoidia bacterium]
MKVQVVSSKYPPEYSGSGNRAHSTYLRLNEKFGVESDVICSSVEFTDRADYQSDGTRVTRVVSPLLRRIDQNLGKGQVRRLTNAAVYHSEARAVTRLLASRNFDIIHVFGYSPATVAAINWSRRRSVPLVLEIVNNIGSPYQYLPGTRKFRSYDLRIQAVIVAISKHISDICAAAGLGQNVWTRPNPVDTQRFSPASGDQRAKTISTLFGFGFGESDKVIVYVSKFMKQKNHEFLVEVMKHLPDEYRLVLAGPTITAGEMDPGMTMEQVPQLQARVDRAGLGERVKIIPGFVDTAEYLSGADLFCFPAQNEAMGTPLIEALSSGTPVVANAGEPSFAEWIIDGENGYLVPLNAEQWATAVQTAAEFGDAQRKQISQSVNARISSDVIDEQYFRLLNGLTTAAPDETVDVEKVLSS